MNSVITNITERWEKGIPHHPKSIKVFKIIEENDWKYGGDYFCWKSGGDGRIHLLEGWNVLCDLCSENYLLNKEIEELATELQKQQAAEVVIDSYDKKQTYIDEFKKLVKKDI